MEFHSLRKMSQLVLSSAAKRARVAAAEKRSDFTPPQSLSRLPGDIIRLVAEFHGISCTGVFTLVRSHQGYGPEKCMQLTNYQLLGRPMGTMRVRVSYEPRFFLVVGRRELVAVEATHHTFEAVAARETARKRAEIQAARWNHLAAMMANRMPVGDLKRRIMECGQEVD